MTLALPPPGPIRLVLPGHAGDGRPAAAGAGRGRPTTSPSWSPSPTSAGGEAARSSRSPVKAAALELGLPVTDRVDDVLDARRPTLGVVVAFGRLIKPHVLDAPADGQPPLLAACPAGGVRRRSSGPSSPATTRTGVDLMAVEEALDTGGDLRPRPRSAIGPDETPTSCAPAWSSGARTCCSTALRRRARRARPQEGERPTPTSSTRPSSQLDWYGPPRSTCTAVRGWAAPGPRTRGQRLKVWRTAVPPRGDGPLGRRTATAPSSWSRSSPRARRGWRPRLGQRRPLDARRPARHVTDRSARRLALDALDRIEHDGRLRQPRCYRRAARPEPARARATAASSPSSSTAPRGCGGPATSSSTASCSARSTRACATRCASAPTSSTFIGCRPTPRSATRSRSSPPSRRAAS